MKIEKLIKKWSKEFGLPIEKQKCFPDPARTRLSIALIEEELTELKEAIVKNDLTETQDSLGDLLWVTVRAMMEHGIKPKSTILAIYKSNMSKADISSTGASKTRKSYQKKGIDTYSIKKGKKYFTYRTSDDKLMKSLLFVTPKFD